jgi:hypothetical protein
VFEHLMGSGGASTDKTSAFCYRRHIRGSICLGVRSGPDGSARAVFGRWANNRTSKPRAELGKSSRSSVVPVLRSRSLARPFIL